MVESAKAVGWGGQQLVQGGGLIDDVDVEFTNCRFARTDYDGKADKEVTAFIADLVDEDGEAHKQMWSVGHEDLHPSQDGENPYDGEDGAPFLINAGKARGVSNTSNFGMLVASMSLAGFPEDKFDGKASSLDGLRAHVMRQEVERKGLKRAKDAKPQEVVVISKINGFPWDAKAKPAAGGKTGAKAGAGAKSKPAAAAAAPTKSAAGADDEVTAEAVTFLMGVLEAQGGSVARSKLAGIAFKELKGNPNRNAIVKLVGSETFLTGDDAQWMYEDGTITAVE